MSQSVLSTNYYGDQATQEDTCVARHVHAREIREMRLHSVLIVRDQFHITTQKWAPNVTSEGLKRPVREANHLPPSSTEFRNE